MNSSINNSAANPPLTNAVNTSVGVKTNVVGRGAADSADSSQPATSFVESIQLAHDAVKQQNEAPESHQENLSTGGNLLPVTDGNPNLAALNDRSTESSSLVLALPVNIEQVIQSIEPQTSVLLASGQMMLNDAVSGELQSDAAKSLSSNELLSNTTGLMNNPMASVLPATQGADTGNVVASAVPLARAQELPVNLTANLAVSTSTVSTGSDADINAAANKTPMNQAAINQASILTATAEQLTQNVAPVVSSVTGIAAGVKLAENDLSLMTASPLVAAKQVELTLSLAAQSSVGKQVGKAVLSAIPDGLSPNLLASDISTQTLSAQALSAQASQVEKIATVTPIVAPIVAQVAQALGLNKQSSLTGGVVSTVSSALDLTTQTETNRPTLLSTTVGAQGEQTLHTTRFSELAGQYGENKQTLLAQRVAVQVEANAALPLTGAVSASVETAAGMVPLPASISLNNPLSFNMLSMAQAEISEAFSRPAWGKGMGKQVLSLVTQNITSAEIRLNPSHLGPIEISIDMREEQVYVSLTSRHAVVREAMEQALPKLREMLDENGFNLAGSDISQHSFSKQHEQAPSADRNNSNSENIQPLVTGEMNNPMLQQTVGTTASSVVDYYI